MKWTPPIVAIRALEPECMELAIALSNRTGLSLANDTTQNEAKHWELQLSPSNLTLKRPDGLATNIDFQRGKAVQRSQEKSFASQPLARALGLQKLKQRNDNAPPTVIDATAGFGTDGWMMASLGCKVRMLEACVPLYAMLDTAVSSAMGIYNESTASRVSVINTDAITYLNNNKHESADIIYLDPMYPQARSSALVKKGMQLLHELVGPDNNGDRLLRAALATARYRVIVKRPKGAPLLDGSEHWSGQITNVSSAQTRFDVYHIKP